MIEVFGNNVLISLDYEFAQREKEQQQQSIEAATRFFEENQSIGEGASLGELPRVPVYPAFDMSGVAIGFVQACGSLVNPPEQTRELKPNPGNIFLKQFAALNERIGGLNAPVNIGDKVLFRRYGATSIPVDGADRLLIVEASNIIARLKPEPEVAHESDLP
jgi:co-chaperonin GroES (HSP10)